LLLRQRWPRKNKSGRLTTAASFQLCFYSNGGRVPLLGGVVVVVGEVVLLGGVPTVGEAPAGGHGDVIEALVPLVAVVLLPVAVVPVVLVEAPAPT
jgi:hypothetical protein